MKPCWEGDVLRAALRIRRLRRSRTLTSGHNRHQFIGDAMVRRFDGFKTGITWADFPIVGMSAARIDKLKKLVARCFRL